MEIEILSFIITPKDRVEGFLAADEEGWDPWLRRQRGFLRKTYQRYPEGRLDVRVFWASKRDWDKAAKDPIIPALEVQLKSKFLGVATRIP